MRFQTVASAATLLAAASLARADDVPADVPNMSEEYAKGIFGKLTPPTDSAVSARGALGTAVLDNRCPYPVYLWSVDFDHGAPAMITIPARTRHEEQFRQPSNGGGVSMKVSKSTSVASGIITQFEYTVAGEQIWYDISFVNCAVGQNADSCPGHEHGLRMECENGSCPVLQCLPGEFCPEQVYYNPGVWVGGPDPTRSTGYGNTNIRMLYTMCTDQAPLFKRDALEGKSIAGRITVS